MKNIAIREMNKSDITEVVNMICEAYDNENIWLDYRHAKILPEIEYAFTDDPIPDCYKQTFFVAVIDNEIVGVGGIIGSFMSDNIFELSWGTVKPKYQRQGIGTLLIQHRIDFGKFQRSHGYFMVSTRYPELFKKFGFNEVFRYDNSNSGVCYLKF